MEQTVPEMSPEDVQGLYLNLKFDGMHLTCITGTSFRTFTMDKSLEHAWDEMVKKFFLKKKLNLRLRKEGKFVFVGVKISRQQEVFLTEERPYPPLLLHRSAGPALPQPVDNCTGMWKHSCRGTTVYVP